MQKTLDYIDYRSIKVSTLTLSLQNEVSRTLVEDIWAARLCSNNLTTGEYLKKVWQLEKENAWWIFVLSSSFLIIIPIIITLKQICISCTKTRYIDIPWVYNRKVHIIGFRISHSRFYIIWSKLHIIGDFSSQTANIVHSISISWSHNTTKCSKLY